MEMNMQFERLPANKAAFFSPLEQAPKIGHGSLTIDLGWTGGFQTLTIYGGPYDNFPEGKMFGLCVRRERTKRRTDMLIPIEDFQVPSNDFEVLDGVKAALDKALWGVPVYVGCMGGWGRTGLILAIIAKAAGVKDPVGFVRENYTSHAVETEDQQAYVAEFDVGELRSHLFWAGWKRYWQRMFWR
jgi:hypothetical protein